MTTKRTTTKSGSTVTTTKGKVVAEQRHVDVTPAKPMTRTELLAALAERKYEGPVSFTATTLRDVLAWLDAGANPGDESIPTGVRFAIHPHLRPVKAPKSRRLSKGYTQALRDLLDQRDPKAWATTLLAEVDA